MVFNSSTDRKATIQHGATSTDGVVRFKCLCGATTQKSMLKTWRVYNTDGWSLESTASGYHAAERKLSRVIVNGEGGGPLNFYIELEQEQ